MIFGDVIKIARNLLDKWSKTKILVSTKESFFSGFDILDQKINDK
jgi:hypothetical protein